MTERDVYLNALKKETPVERAAFLEEACAGDEALRGQVEILLQAQPDTANFREPSAAAPETGGAGTSCPDPRPALASGATHKTQPVADKPATRIGPYKLVRKIGEGGMGAVYL